VKELRPDLLRRDARVKKPNESNTGGHARNQRQPWSPDERTNDLVKATLMPVELGGLEPLAFSLRRDGVDLIGREHGVIDVQVAAAGAP
jgi:hypothetical protein